MGGTGPQRRADIVKFVAKFTKRHGHSPTIAEIAEALDIGVSTAWHHVNKLKQEGSLTFERNQARTIRLLDK